MTGRAQRFYEYPADRDVVFVLGAGASVADGAPLQRDLLDYIVSSDDPMLCNNAIGSEVRDFVNAWFSGELEAALPPSLEEVFGLIDYHISERESPGDLWHADSLQILRGALISCIHHAVHAGRSEGASIYREFWKKISEFNRNVSIITMNYDALIEEAFDPFYSSRALLDYCIPLINYEMPDGVPGFFWWEDPRKPIHIWEGADPVPIKLLKVHGSLNWRYCSICRGVLLAPWSTEIDLETNSFNWNTGSSCEGPGIDEELVCPYDRTPFETLILPPSHFKTWSHPALSPILTESIRELRAARTIVFIGYSFPEADVHFRSVFARSVRDAEIIVVNPSLTERGKARYRSTFPGAVFVGCHFDEFISRDLEHILSGSLT